MVGQMHAYVCIRMYAYILTFSLAFSIIMSGFSVHNTNISLYSPISVHPIFVDHLWISVSYAPILLLHSLQYLTISEEVGHAHVHIAFFEKYFT